MGCYLCLKLPLWAWLPSIGGESWCPHALKPSLCLALPYLPWCQISLPTASRHLHGQGLWPQLLPKLGPSHLLWATADPQPPILCGSPRSDSANPEKVEFRPKCPLVPLIKKRIAEMMVVLGRTFKLTKYCFQVPQKLCFSCK